MKMDLIQMIDTLERAQQTHYAEGVQNVIRDLREMLKDELSGVIEPDPLRTKHKEALANEQ